MHICCVLCVCLGCSWWRVTWSGENRRKTSWVREAAAPSSTKPSTEASQWPSNTSPLRNADSRHLTAAQVRVHHSLPISLPAGSAFCHSPIVGQLCLHKRFTLKTSFIIGKEAPYMSMNMPEWICMNDCPWAFQLSVQGTDVLPHLAYKAIVFKLDNLSRWNIEK